MDITNDKSSRFLIPNFEKKDSKSNSKKEKQLKYAKILDGDLERLGFFAVFNNPDKPKESFVELMESHNQEREKVWTSIDTIYKEKISRFTTRIQQLESLLNDEKANINEHKINSTESKQKELEELKKTSDQLPIPKTFRLALKKKIFSFY